MVQFGHISLYVQVVQDAKMFVVFYLDIFLVVLGVLLRTDQTDAACLKVD